MLDHEYILVKCLLGVTLQKILVRKNYSPYGLYMMPVAPPVLVLFPDHIWLIYHSIQYMVKVVLKVVLGLGLRLPLFFRFPSLTHPSQHAVHSEPWSGCCCYYNRGDSRPLWLPHAGSVPSILSLRCAHCRWGI